MRLCILLLASACFCMSMGQKLGGWTEKSISDPSIVAAAEAGLVSLNAQSNSLYKIQQVSIISARVQVVAGVKYEIEINAGLSSCPQNSMIANTLEACPVNHPERYVLTVVEKSWATPRYTLLEHTVQSIPPEDSPPATTVGGPTASDISVDAMRAAREGLKIFNGVSDAGTPFVITEITSVTTQVVAGTLFQLHIKGGQGTCLDGTVGTPEEEQTRKEAWLRQGLAIGTVNEFGDSTDTMYTGGTPLFDEMTGQQVDIMDYLEAQHQDKPWDSLCTPEHVAEYSMVVWDQPWRQPNRFELQSHTLPMMKKGGDSKPNLEDSAQATPSDEDGPAFFKLQRVFRVLGISLLLAGVVGYGFYAVNRGDVSAMAESEHVQIAQQEEEEEGEEVGLSKGTELKASV